MNAITIENPIKALTIHQSSRTKVSSVYVNKTFSLKYTGSFESETGGWDSYEATLKSGGLIVFTKYAEFGWFVRRESGHRGTWLHDVTESV